MLLFTSGSTGGRRASSLATGCGPTTPSGNCASPAAYRAAHPAVRAAELRHGLPGDLLHAVRRRRAATHLQPRADGPLRVAACPRTPPGPARAVALRRPATPRRGLQHPGRAPGALRVVVSSGEQLRITEDVRAFCAAMPGLLLENQYGPTETHQVTYHSLSGDPAHYPDLPPIGGRWTGSRCRCSTPRCARYRSALPASCTSAATASRAATTAPRTHRRALRRTSLAPRRQALPHRRPRAHPRQRRDRLARPRRYPGQGPRLPHRAGRGRAGDHAPGRAPAGPARRGGGSSRAPGQRCIPRCLPARRARGGGSRRTEAGAAQRTAGTHGAGTLRLGRRLRPHPSGKRDDAALRALPLEHGTNIEYLARATTTSAPWPDSSASCWIVPGRHPRQLLRPRRHLAQRDALHAADREALWRRPADGRADRDADRGGPRRTPAGTLGGARLRPAGTDPCRRQPPAAVPRPPARRPRTLLPAAGPRTAAGPAGICPAGGRHRPGQYAAGGPRGHRRQLPRGDPPGAAGRPLLPRRLVVRRLRRLRDGPATARARPAGGRPTDRARLHHRRPQPRRQRQRRSPAAVLLLGTGLVRAQRRGGRAAA
ncbi:non-ribosomal peptide synthetase [Pseudomonas aeruginosa]|nr:non-ribosomal peptide synthetase [Pseudomonas aeruginosa]